MATVNPCGFAMLPAYLSFFIGGDRHGTAPGGTTTATSLGRGLVVGGVVSAGFLAVFGAAGVLLTAGVQATVRALPWAAMVVGIGVIVLGIAMLAGHELRVSLPRVGRSGDGKGLGGVFLFGISYAIASLSCTLPVFLVVAGAYIVVFWVSTLAGDGTSQLAPVVWVERLSSVATNWISRWAGVLGIVASVAVAVIAVWAARHRSHLRSSPR